MKKLIILAVFANTIQIQAMFQKYIPSLEKKNIERAIHLAINDQDATEGENIFYQLEDLEKEYTSEADKNWLNNQFEALKKICNFDFEEIEEYENESSNDETSTEILNNSKFNSLLNSEIENLSKSDLTNSNKLAELTQSTIYFLEDQQESENLLEELDEEKDDLKNQQKSLHNQLSNCNIFEKKIRDTIIFMRQQFAQNLKEKNLKLEKIATEKENLNTKYNNNERRLNEIENIENKLLSNLKLNQIRAEEKAQLKSLSIEETKKEIKNIRLLLAQLEEQKQVNENSLEILKNQLNDK